MMSLRLMVLGHLRSLQQHLVRTLLLVVAVGAGVSLVVGVVVANASLNHSLGQFSNRLSGAADFRIEGPYSHGSLDVSVLPKVQSTPGVAAAIPLVVSVVQVADSNGHESMVPALGIDCAIEKIVGGFNCTPETIAALGDRPIIGTALQKRLGAGGQLRTNLAVFDTSKVFAIEQLGQVNHGMVAVFGLAASQRQLTRPNGLENILVVAQPGTDRDALRARLTTAVGPQNRVEAKNAKIGAAWVSALLLPFLYVISLIGLVIGGQVVRNTLEMSLEERRREFATTAALGATPRTLLIGLLGEGALVGVFGGFVAIAGGYFVGHAFVASLAGEIAKATGLRIDVYIPPSVVVVSIVLAVGLAVISSIRPARRAARLDLVAELSGRAPFEAERTTSRRRLAVTGLAALGCVGLALAGRMHGSTNDWQPIAGVVALVGSAIVATIACAQLSPLLLASFRRAPGFTTGPGRVALLNVGRARRRTTAITVAIAGPVIISTVFGGALPGIKRGAHDFAKVTYGGSVYVSTLAPNNTADIDSKLPPDLVAKVAAFPGVAGVDPWYFTSSNGQLLALNGQGFVPDYHVFAGERGPVAIPAGRVMIGPAYARAHHLKPGDTFSLPARTAGSVQFTVGGIWASAESSGYSVALRPDQMFQLTGEQPSQSFVVHPASGVSAEALARDLRAARLDPRLRIYAPDDLAVAMSKEFIKIASPIQALQSALVIVAAIATASTLFLAAAQRKRDNAVLAAIGMAPSDLARSTLFETSITALAATIAAAFCAQLLLVVFTWASAFITGLDIPYSLNLVPVLVASVVTTALALVGAAFPAWRTARTNVMTALRTA
jgi:putative ABC transport system permease protein